MPTYEYEHTGKACKLGRIFETTQSIHDDRLTKCPECGGAITRLISRPYVSSPKSDSDLRNMGFTKLVKRDDGIYENVTRRGSDKQFMTRGDAESVPDISKTISD